MRVYLFVLIAFLAISCEKEEKIPIEKLLTQRTWKADQVRTQFKSGLYEFYKRGEANPGTYDSDSIRFNLDKTGIYYYQGVPHATTWEFSSTAKDKIKLIVNYTTGPEELSWENVNITVNQLQYAQFPRNTNAYLASVIRTPN